RRRDIGDMQHIDIIARHLRWQSQRDAQRRWPWPDTADGEVAWQRPTHAERRRIGRIEQVRSSGINLREAVDQVEDIGLVASLLTPNHVRVNGDTQWPSRRIRHVSSTPPLILTSAPFRAADRSLPICHGAELATSITGKYSGRNHGLTNRVRAPSSVGGGCRFVPRRNSRLPAARSSLLPRLCTT